MSTKEIPNHYQSLKKRFPKTMDAIENLGSTVVDEGPLEKKVGHLVKLVAAAVTPVVGLLVGTVAAGLIEGISFFALIVTILLAIK